MDQTSLGKLAALDDEQRRALYDFVIAQGRATKEEAARATGMSRSLASYHLDLLVEHGLLAASFERPPGRGGPGAGRPAKVYARADAEIAVTVPPRDYRLLADLLARAIEADGSGAVASALRRVARQMGADLAAPPKRRLSAARQEETLRARLEAEGYEPFDDEDAIRLRNCPFHRLARSHTDLVCGMNLDVMRGLTRALGGAVSPSLEPTTDGCCVAFRRER